MFFFQISFLAVVICVCPYLFVQWAWVLCCSIGSSFIRLSRPAKIGSWGPTGSLGAGTVVTGHACQSWPVLLWWSRILSCDLYPHHLSLSFCWCCCIHYGHEWLDLIGGSLVAWTTTTTTRSQQRCDNRDGDPLKEAQLRSGDKEWPNRWRKRGGFRSRHGCPWMCFEKSDGVEGLWCCWRPPSIEIKPTPGFFCHNDQ